MVGAQLLQMHEAAAECKDFLARMRHQPRPRQQQQQYPTILKPIPSRPIFGAVGGEGYLMAAAAAAAAALAWRNAWVRTENFLTFFSPICESRNCFLRNKIAGMEPALAHGVSDAIFRGPESYRQPSVIINHSDSRIVLSPGLSSDAGGRG